MSSVEQFIIFLYFILFFLCADHRLIFLPLTRTVLLGSKHVVRNNINIHSLFLHIARTKTGQASSPQSASVGNLASYVTKLATEHAERYDRVPGRLGRFASAGSAFHPAAGSRAKGGGQGGGGGKNFSSWCAAPAALNATFSRGGTQKCSSSRSASSATNDDRATDIIQRVESIVNDRVLPIEQAILGQGYAPGPSKWEESKLLEPLKSTAKEEGLWNLFLPDVGGLTNAQYARAAEKMGHSILASEVFNCQAPDSGNMELLHMFGSEEQKANYLQPLLEQSIRSAFAMTEPNVASSDATNMEATITPDGDELVLNGRKWWTSNGCHPNLGFIIFMGKDSNPASDTPRHRRHSMVLVPFPAKGVEVVRPLTVFGYDDAPHGHAEVMFDNVRVPKSMLIGNLGDGFTIAQARLGPGRIHHCMRLIGMAERSLSLAIQRANERTAFGKSLSSFGVNKNYFADSRIEIDSARFLVLNAARKIDEVGARKAMKEIAMIKVVTPEMCMKVVDGAIQIHGGAGLSADHPLAHFYAWARVLALADGPTEVHKAAIAKLELKKYNKKD